MESRSLMKLKSVWPCAHCLTLVKENKRFENKISLEDCPVLSVLKSFQKEVEAGDFRYVLSFFF